MTSVQVDITRVEVREELQRFREEFREHYATKADLAQLETRLVEKITQVDRSIAWKLAGIVVTGLTGGMAATAAILRLLG